MPVYYETRSTTYTITNPRVGDRPTSSRRWTVSHVGRAANPPIDTTLAPGERRGPAWWARAARDLRTPQDSGSRDLACAGDTTQLSKPVSPARHDSANYNLPDTSERPADHRPLHPDFIARLNVGYAGQLGRASTAGRSLRSATSSGTVSWSSRYINGRIAGPSSRGVLNIKANHLGGRLELDPLLPRAERDQSIRHQTTSVTNIRRLIMRSLFAGLLPRFWFQRFEGPRLANPDDALLQINELHNPNTGSRPRSVPGD
jgi:hypothetical protein